MKVDAVLTSTSSPLPSHRLKATPTHSTIMRLQLLPLSCLGFLAFTAIQSIPVENQCMDTTSCMKILDEFYSQLSTMPNHIHERSIAPWTYQEKIDPYRVPPILFEAKCLTSHSCKSPDGSTSLETIPISIKIPVLKKNVFKKCTSLEYETVSIACLCAVPRYAEIDFNSKQSLV